MSSIHIIEADLAHPFHAQGVVELIDGYARDPMAGGAPLSNEVRERLIPELQKQSHCLILLALADEKPVGVAVSFIGFSTFAAKPLINVHDLAVHPDYRRRGIGRRLLEEVERHARKRGCCRVTLEVLANNAVARNLYRRLGFRGDGVEGEATFFLTRRLEP